MQRPSSRRRLAHQIAERNDSDETLAPVHDGRPPHLNPAHVRARLRCILMLETVLHFFCHGIANLGDRPLTLRDATHHDNYGAYELAKCIVEGIKQQLPDLAKQLKPGLPTFDPAHPDPFDFVKWPLSPQQSSVTPPGN